MADGEVVLSVEQDVFDSAVVEYEDAAYYVYGQALGGFGGVVVAGSVYFFYGEGVSPVADEGDKFIVCLGVPSFSRLTKSMRYQVVVPEFLYSPPTSIKGLLLSGVRCRVSRLSA